MSKIDLTPVADSVYYQNSWPGGHYNYTDSSPASNSIAHSFYDPGFYNATTTLTFDTSWIDSRFTKATLYIDVTSISAPDGTDDVATIGNGSDNLVAHSTGWVGIDVSGLISYGGTTSFSSAFSGPYHFSGLDVEFASLASPGYEPYLEFTAPITVGPSGDYDSLANGANPALPNVVDGDTINFVGSYSNESAAITANNLTFDGDATSTGISLSLSGGAHNVTLTGAAPINVVGSGLSDTITGNAGANSVATNGGSDTVNAGGGDDLVDARNGVAQALSGGTGNDYVLLDVSSRAENLSLSFASQSDAGGSHVVALPGGTTINGFEGIRLNEGSGDSAVDFSGATVATNALATAAGDTRGAYVIEGTGNNSVTVDTGTHGSILVDGGAGGNDTLTADLSGVTDVVSVSPVSGFYYDAHRNDLSWGSNYVQTNYVEHFHVTAGSNFDSLDGLHAADVYFDGGAGDDWIRGSHGNDTILGSAGNDVLIGLGGTNTIDGGADNDLVDTTGDHADTLIGGTGNDYAILDQSGQAGDLNLTFGQQTDAAGGTVTLLDGTTVTGFEGFTIQEGSGNNTVDLTGTTVVGNAPDGLPTGAVINGGSGSNALTVDSGTHGTVWFDGSSGSNDTLTADLSGVTDPVTLSMVSGFNYDRYREDLSWGSNYVGTNHVEHFHITSGSGNDSLDGSHAWDVYFDAGAGDDWMRGSGGDDTLLGGTGHDVLISNGGSDTIDGGADNDLVNANGEQGGSLTGGSGDDYVVLDQSGQTGDLNFTFGLQTDVNAGTLTLLDGTSVTGFEGFYLQEGSGNNTVDISSTTVVADTADGYNYGAQLVGGSGSNTLVVDANTQGSVWFDGGAGSNDTLSADLSNASTAITLSTVSGFNYDRYREDLSWGSTYVGTNHVENFVIKGGSAGDYLDGSHAASVNFDGRGGADTLIGGSGDDTFTGGQGNDTIDGGGGTNTAIYSGNASDYTFTLLGNGDLQIADQRSGNDNGVDYPTDGTDTVRNVQHFQFADGTYTQAQLIPTINNAPVLSNIGSSHTAATEQTFVKLATAATVADVELDALTGGAGGSGDYNGASLTIARLSGANTQDAFSFDTSGALFTVDTVNHTLSGGAGNHVFATYSSPGGDSLQVTFDDYATTALVNDAMQHVSYKNLSDTPPASVTVHYSFNDGNTGAQGTGGNGIDTADRVVDITAVNDPPVNTLPGSFSAPSNLDLALTGLSVADPDATSLTTTLHVDHGTLAVASIAGDASVSGSGTATVTLSGTVAQIDATLAATHGVLYHSVFNFSGTDHLTMTSDDGGSYGTGGPLTDTNIAAINVTSSTTGAVMVPAGFDFNFDNNGEGHSDILWQNSSTGTVAVWSAGQPSGGSQLAASMGSSWHMMGVGDFDGNGHGDILWGNDSGSFQVWDNGVPGSAHTIATNMPASWHFAATGDFDGNGRSDILWQNDDGTVAAWDNGQSLGGHIVAGQGAMMPSTMHVAATGDFDGNGKTDVLWQNATNGALTVWTDGQAAKSTTIAASMPASWHVEGTGDFDGNGKSDLLWQNDDGTVAIWDNGQVGHVVAGPGALAGGWHIAGVGDYNGDHHSDILLQNDDGMVAAWDSGLPQYGHVIEPANLLGHDWHIMG